VLLFAVSGLSVSWLAIVQPESLFKALVGLRAQDIMHDRPPLSQHVPELKTESKATLKELRAKF
jgi:hypothetical protein